MLMKTTKLQTEGGMSTVGASQPGPDALKPNQQKIVREQAHTCIDLCILLRCMHKTISATTSTSRNLSFRYIYNYEQRQMNKHVHIQHCMQRIYLIKNYHLKKSEEVSCSDNGNISKTY